MEKRSIFKVVNGLTSALLIAPIISTATMAMAQETNDDETNTIIVYENDFEADPSSDPAIQDAGSTLTHLTDLEFDGNDNNSGVLVTDRGDNWRGIDVRFSGLELEVGQEYSVSILGYIDSEEEIPEDAQLTLQYPETYDDIDATDITPGEYFVLAGEYTHTDEENDEGKVPEAFRVMSNEVGKDIEFAIADILITTEESAETDPGEDEPGDEESGDDSDNGSGDEDADDDNGSEGETDDNDDQDEYQSEDVYVTDFDTDNYPNTIVTPASNATVEWTNELDVEGNENTSGVWVTNRNNNYDGIDLPFDALGLEEGTSYVIEVSGYIDEDEEIPEDSTINLETADGYDWLDNQPAVAGEIFNLEATYTAFEDGSDHSFRIKSNDNGAQINFAVTSISVTSREQHDGGTDLPPAEDFILIDFENGELNDVKPRDGNEELVLTSNVNAIPEDGDYSLHVSNRQATHQGPALEVTEYINLGETYEVSVWVKNDSDVADDIKLSSQIGEEAPTYSNIVTENISFADGWVLLQGTQRYDSVADGYVIIYVESDNPDLEFYIDGVNFQAIDSEALDPDFSLLSIANVYENYFDIGNVVSMTDLVEPTLGMLKHHHNLLTAENAMKPDGVANDDGEFTFDGANTIVDAVFEEGFDLHGHVLVWHSQSPDWHHTDENGEPLSRDAALNNMYTHIEEVMRNFGPEVRSWDVVNEALDGDWQNPEDWESNLRVTGFQQAIGDDYIYLAFEHARKIADELGRQDMVLYYNDYNDHIQPKAETMYHMIKDVNEQWSEENPNDNRDLISGVGMQGHYSININPENVKQSIERFEQLGIDIGITELDVTTNTSNEYVEDEHIRQGQIYARLFQIFREHSDSIDRVTFWGLDDASSWRSDRYPLLFDSQFRAKLAYHAVIDPDQFLEDYPLQDSEGNHSYAFYGTPEMGADEIDDIWNEAPVLNMNQMQQAHEVAATGNGRVLWDEDNLYVLLQVNDTTYDDEHQDAHEQDSVEVFVNETGDYATSYIDGVGQYRVNFNNVASFNPGDYNDGFESHATLTDSGYTVEMAIPWKGTEPAAWHTIGFDIQINDAVDGSRHGVAAWNDDSGMGWSDPSVFGRLTLGTTMEELILLLEERISNLEETISENEENLAELTSELVELQDLLNVLQDELGQANETISELEERVRELEERLAELEAGDEEEPGDDDNDEDPTEPEEIIEVEEDTPTPVLPGQTVVLPDGDTSIETPADLPESTEIIVEYLDEADLPELNVDGDYTLVIAGEVVRVTMVYPEGEEDFTGNFELTLGIADDFVGEEVFIYYYNEETGLWEQRVAEIYGDTITTTVTHFSIYGVFAQVEDDSEGMQTDDEDEAGDDSSTGTDEDDDSDDQDDVTEEEEDADETLPQTATATWTVGLIGLMGLVTGSGIHFIRKRK